MFAFTYTGKALLWAIFDDFASSFVDDAIIGTVKGAYSRIANNLAQDENPVAKVPLNVSNSEGNMVLSELLDLGVANQRAGDDDLGPRRRDSDPNRNVRQRVGESSAEVSKWLLFFNLSSLTVLTFFCS